MNIVKLLLSPLFSFLGVFFERFRASEEFKESILCSGCGAWFDRGSLRCPYCEYSPVRGKKKPYRHGYSKFSGEKRTDFADPSPSSSTTVSFEVDGKEYDRIEDVPSRYRRVFEDKDNNGILDHLERRTTGNVYDAPLPSSTTVSFEIDGKEYHRIEDVPSEYREMFEDKDNNGIPDHFGGEMTDKVFYDGQFYDSIEDLPAEVREAIRDDNNNGIPDNVEGRLHDGALPIKLTETGQFSYNGRLYDSLEDLSDEIWRPFSTNVGKPLRDENDK